jgi:hypothetical protein
MNSSRENKSLFTADPELEDTPPKRKREDIPVLVKEEVPRTPECPKKFFGSEDKEFKEDS